LLLSIGWDEPEPLKALLGLNILTLLKSSTKKRFKKMEATPTMNLVI
jgi:hypothetical protein